MSLLRKYFDRSPDSVRALLHSTVFDLTPFSFQDIAILAGCQAVFVDLDQKYVKVKRVIPSGSNDQLVFGDTIKVWRLHPSSTVSFLPVQPANKRPHLRRPPINYTNYHCTVEVVPTPPFICYVNIYQQIRKGFIVSPVSPPHLSHQIRWSHSASTAGSLNNRIVK